MGLVQNYDSNFNGKDFLTICKIEFG